MVDTSEHGKLQLLLYRIIQRLWHEEASGSLTRRGRTFIRGVRLRTYQAGRDCESWLHVATVVVRIEWTSLTRLTCSIADPRGL